MQLRRKAIEIPVITINDAEALTAAVRQLVAGNILGAIVNVKKTQNPKK
ncbi:MAG: hypothetical protein AAB495_00940 [Patescibacteria group bacterium]